MSPSPLARATLAVLIAALTTRAGTGQSSSIEPATPSGQAPEAPAPQERAEGPAPLPPTLTLQDAVARALAAAPPVAAARAVEDAARAQLVEAQADLVPVLSLGGSAFRYEEPMLVTPIHAFRPNLLPSFDRTVAQGDLQLRYDLWDGGARGARVAQRREELAAAQAAAGSTAGSVAAHAIAAFLGVRTYDEQILAHEDRRRALAAERERVEQLLAVGRAAQVDLLRVQAAEASARADRVGLAATRESAARDLLRLMGEDPQSRDLPPLAAATLASEGALERDWLLERARERSPEVLRAQRDLAAAEASVDAARAARGLLLRAEGHLLGFAGGNGDNAGEWNAGVRLAVPLWDRHVAARVALAEAGRDGAAAALRQAEDQVGSTLDRAYAELAAAQARAESLVEAEARHAEVLRVEKLRLSAGAGVESDYLGAEADLLAARAAAAEARNRVAAARAELARATGDLSAEWVTRAFAIAEPGDGVRPEDRPEGRPQ